MKGVCYLMPGRRQLEWKKYFKLVPQTSHLNKCGASGKE